MSRILICVAMIYAIKAQRYFRDDDNDIVAQFGSTQVPALPIDQCFQSTTLPAAYTKYECSTDGLTVTKTKWTTFDCSGTPTSTDSYNSSNAINSCGNYHFNCNGIDKFVTTGYYQDATCQTLVIAIPTVEGCFCETALASTDTTCTTPSTGNIDTFTDTNTCSTTGTSQDLSQCTHVIDLFAGAFIIYSKITDCTSITPTTATPTGTPTTATPTATRNPTNTPTTPYPSVSPTTPPPTFPVRYFLDQDIDSLKTYAFAINICFQNTNLGTTYSKYECASDSLSVTKTTWSTVDCTGTPDTSVIYNTSSATSSCGQFNFECNGFDDYTLVGLYFNDQTCANTQRSMPLVNGCFCDTDTTSYEISCTKTPSGHFQTWSDSTTCGTVPSQVEDENSCYFSFQQFNVVNVYAKQSGCITSGGSYTPTSAPVNIPSMSPTLRPTNNPLVTGQTHFPSISPSKFPSTDPSKTPSNMPSESPIMMPTSGPTQKPTQNPLRPDESHSPSLQPSMSPIVHVSINPSKSPSINPSEVFIYSTDSGEELNASWLNGSVVMGLVIGGVIVFILIIVVMIWCCMCKKNSDANKNGVEIQKMQSISYNAGLESPRDTAI
eukprot:283226_1